MAIDLNADVGESRGDWRTDDAAILRLVTSASVACGGHCGDATTMHRTVDLAVENGVSVGAHVSYADVEGFGRRFVDLAPDELADLVAEQIGALHDAATAAGTRVRYVKPHGALYNTVVHHTAQAEAVVRGIVRCDLGLAVVALPGGELARLAGDSGVRVVGEAFLDRAYRDDATLVPRSEPGAVLHGTDEIASRAVGLALRGEVVAQSGVPLAVDAQTLCLDGDTDVAAQMLVAVRRALEAAGVEVRSFA